MGTNYYAAINKPSIRKGVHIGKNSYGWLFAFQYQNNSYRDIPIIWNSYEDIKSWLKTYTVDRKDFCIIDEYDEQISYEEFIKLVESKQKDKQSLNNPNNFTYFDNVKGYRFKKGDFS